MDDYSQHPDVLKLANNVIQGHRGKHRERLVAEVVEVVATALQLWFDEQEKGVLWEQKSA
jgi:hypothetical protein